METRKHFKGSVVIGDPSYFTLSEDDWELCGYGKQLEKLGFSDCLYIDFPDDPQAVIDENGNVLGHICQDSGVLTVVYKSELMKYNPDYEEAFYDEDNRTIIEDFEGEIGYKAVSLTVNGREETDTLIVGTGNINFTSCYPDG